MEIYLQTEKRGKKIIPFKINKFLSFLYTELLVQWESRYLRCHSTKGDFKLISMKKTKIESMERIHGGWGECFFALPNAPVLATLGLAGIAIGRIYACWNS